MSENTDEKIIGSRENLMNSDHKGTNEVYRENYDKIRWDIQEEMEKGKVLGHFI